MTPRIADPWPVQVCVSWGGARAIAPVPIVRSTPNPALSLRHRILLRTRYHWAFVYWQLQATASMHAAMC
eukprot:scaffold12722_cov118-Isochrysis_galbana.AAC.4